MAPSPSPVRGDRKDTTSMARQTRRRRDSKSKNRYRPRLPSGSGRASSEQTEVASRKTEKIDWSTVFILLAIFLFSLYIRTAWTLEPATEDGFQLTGGSDPYLSLIHI